MSELIPIDKVLLRRSFERAADTYDAAAVLQKEVCKRLAEKLEYINFKPQRILDVGAGTGFASYTLQKIFPKAEIIALDIAMPMLQIARQRNGLLSRLRKKTRYVNADTELLPFSDNSFDLVFSNLTLQWVNNLEQVLTGFRRILRNNGMLLFSTFGPDTLKELRASWQSVDQYSHVNDHFKQFQQAYEQFRVDGVLPATYEVVYGHAWSVDENDQPTQPGSAAISLSDIKRS